MKSTPKHHKLTRMNRFSNIDDYKLKPVIPIGPRFQADVPEWRGPILNESESSKWLGTVIWPMKDTTKEIDECVIGKGRSDYCCCTTPGSILCVKYHIGEETTRLQTVLGPAFQKWKFDQMGEAAAKPWKQSDQQRLTQLMKSNPLSECQDSIKLALECFPLKSKKDIVEFYFNVYIPRRMSMQTRSGYMMVNTYDDEEEKKSLFKGSRKKARVDCVVAYSPTLVKARYMTGGR